MVFGDKISIEDFIIESGAQRIVVNSKDNTTNDFVANFSMLDLEGASTYLQLEDIKIHGRVNGEVQLIDFRNNPLLKATITSSDEVRINKDTLGLVNISAEYDIKNKKIDIFKNTQILHKDNKLYVFGNVNIQDSSIKIVASLDKVNIAPIGSFISEYVSDLSGVASGNVNIEGNYNRPNISGEIGLVNTHLKVLFLGTRYSIDKLRLKFNDERISMDDVVIKDEREGDYTGILSGYILHNKFDDLRLNLAVNSSNLLCMNTRSYDNDLFYGYVPAKVNMTVKGLIDDITMNINAKPLKGSKFYLPINSTGDVSSYDYIQFAKIGRLQGELEENKKPYYLKLNMNVDATPDAEVIIVLDQNTGEEIQAKGNGAIQLNVDLGNDINMFGNYVMTEGKYLFNFRGLIPREFDIEENSKITWTGDAVNARLDVNAIYKLPKKLPLYPLISAQYNSLDETDQAESKKTYTTFLELILKGSLGSPDIKFNITQPDNKAIGTAAYTKLEQIKNDEKELVSQSGILLLLGEFKTSGGGITNSTAQRGSIATVSDMVSSALSSEMTNIFQKLTGLNNISLNLGYQSYDAVDNINNTSRNEFKVNVSANLLKNRVIVDVGNSVDVGKDGSGKTTSNFIGGDFKAQFLISEDGRLRANAYRTNSTNTIDASSGENFTKGGVGLSYRKVFNSFADLFSSKKKRQRIPIADTLIKTES
jgi:hypothetical protein